MHERHAEHFDIEVDGRLHVVGAEREVVDASPVGESSVRRDCSGMLLPQTSQLSLARTSMLKRLNHV
jgi:hypothetical protein